MNIIMLINLVQVFFISVFIHDVFFFFKISLIYKYIPII